jgi:hypothetical protein
LASSQTATLLRAEQVEVRRLVVKAGKEIAEHKAKGEIVVYCLEGKVAQGCLPLIRLAGGEMLRKARPRNLFLNIRKPDQNQGGDDEPLPKNASGGGRDIAVLPQCPRPSYSPPSSTPSESHGEGPQPP